jgi:hypothetical protein
MSKNMPTLKSLRFVDYFEYRFCPIISKKKVPLTALKFRYVGPGSAWWFEELTGHGLSRFDNKVLPTNNVYLSTVACVADVSTKNNNRVSHVKVSL